MSVAEASGPVGLALIVRGWYSRLEGGSLPTFGDLSGRTAVPCPPERARGRVDKTFSFPLDIR
jgi:hypothetical protein